MHKANNNRTQKVKNNHNRNYLFGNRRNSLKTADNNKTCKNENNNTCYKLRYTEGIKHISCNCVYLCHIADTERREQTETTEKYGKYRTDLLTTLFCTEAVLQIVHCTA